MSSPTSSALGSESLTSGIETGLMRRTLKAMILSRILESKLSSLYKAGKIVGGFIWGRVRKRFQPLLDLALIRVRIFSPH